MQVAVIGKYPRLPAPEGRLSARDVARKVAADGDITQEQAARLYTDVAAWMMEDQRANGADQGTDGLVRWDDPWTGFARGIRGFTLGRRVQEYGTNTLYRRPIAVAPLRWEQPVTLAAYHAAQAAAPPGFLVLPYLPGPLSLALASDALPTIYPTPNSFAVACAEVLTAELQALLATAPAVFLGEPALAADPRNFGSNVGYAARIAASVDASRVILLTWGGAAPVGYLLDHASLGGVGVDLVAAPNAWQVAEGLPPAVCLYAGVVDAASALVERPEDLIPLIRKIVRQHPNTVLCPNRHFTVPRSIAAAKLRVLRTVGDSL